MKPIRPPRRSLGPALFLGLLVLVGLLGIGGTLLALSGVSFFKRPASEPSHEGMVALPVSAKPIPAYTQVTRDYLLDPATGTLKVVYVRPEEAGNTPGLITSVDRILYRVVNHDKPAGFDFTETDFLPPGTRPGLVA